MLFVLQIFNFTTMLISDGLIGEYKCFKRTSSGFNFFKSGSKFTNLFFDKKFNYG